SARRLDWSVCSVTIVVAISVRTRARRSRDDERRGCGARCLGGGRRLPARASSKWHRSTCRPAGRVGYAGLPERELLQAPVQDLGHIQLCLRRTCNLMYPSELLRLLP